MAGNSPLHKLSATSTNLSNALEIVDQLQKGKAAVDAMSSFAKASSAFAGLGIALDIGLTFLGPEDPQMALLKEVAKGLQRVEKSIGKLQQTVDDGFVNLDRKMDYLAAQNQVFEAISRINVCTKKIAYFFGADDRQAAIDSIVEDDDDDFQNLSNYFEDIRRTCAAGVEISVQQATANQPMDMLAVNIMNAAIPVSFANADMVTKIGMQLLGAARMAHFCECMFYKLKYRDEPATCGSRLKKMEFLYADGLAAIEATVMNRVQTCADYSVAQSYAEALVRKAVKTMSTNSKPGKAPNLKENNQAQAASGYLWKTLGKAYPAAEIIAATWWKHNYTDNPHQANSLAGSWAHLPSLPNKHKIFWWEDTYYRGIILIAEKETFRELGRKWHTYLSARPAKFFDTATWAYSTYYYDNNLHHYISDGGDRPFGPYPYIVITRRMYRPDSIVKWKSSKYLRHSYTSREQITGGRDGIDMFIPYNSDN